MIEVGEHPGANTVATISSRVIKAGIKLRNNVWIVRSLTRTTTADSDAY